MAMMCRMSGGCTSGKGMCIHEKMMVVMVLVAAPLAGHFALHWF